MAMLIRSFIAHYKLTEQDCRREVSDTDIAKIASSIRGKWKTQLPPRLGLDPIVVDDILVTYITEEDRRFAFFKEWKLQYGFDATYKILISSLLEINRRQDAGKVCEILKETISSISGIYTCD